MLRKQLFMLRRIVENAFGIMSARYRILLRPIGLSPINVENVVKVTCVLRNFLHSKSDSVYCSPKFMDSESASGNIAQGLWGAEAAATSPFGLQPTSATNFTRTASNVRDTFAKYFVKGVVPWQWGPCRCYTTFQCMNSVHTAGCFTLVPINFLKAGPTPSLNTQWQFGATSHLSRPLGDWGIF